MFSLALEQMQEAQQHDARRRSSIPPIVDGPEGLDYTVRRRSTTTSANATRPVVSRPNFSNTTIDKLQDKTLLHIFNFLEHTEISRLAQVSKKWERLAYNNQLWQNVSFRPEFAGIVAPPSVDRAVELIAKRFGAQLKYIELPIEHICAPVFHELAAKCPNLSHMVLDFSNAMQLHDFNDLNAFPAKLRTLCICLSDVIFMEGFMRKIYNFINSVEVLQLVGKKNADTNIEQEQCKTDAQQEFIRSTKNILQIKKAAEKHWTYERVSEEEEEVHETLHILKLKSHVPNLRVINFFGVKFLDDSHVEAISSNCVHLECLCIKFCTKFTGSSLKILLQRCRKLSCLLMEQTGLTSNAFQDVEWEKSRLCELDITSCEITSEALISVLGRIKNLKWLCAGYVDGLNDKVLESIMQNGLAKALQSVDFQCCDYITEEILFKFLEAHGNQLVGLNLSGIPFLAETFWTQCIPFIRKTRVIIMGTAKICTISRVSSKIHVDQIIDCVAVNCPNIERLEIRWDPDTLRFSDKSSKFVDTLRVKATKLRSFVLSDGEYFELVKSNFERAHRRAVVRTTVCCTTTLLGLLPYFKDLRFN